MKAFIACNQIKCKKCDTVIYSAHRHDMKYCKCGAVYVDGGMVYLKRGGQLDQIIEQSIVIDQKLGEALFAQAETCVKDKRSHWGAVASIFDVLKDLGYEEALTHLNNDHTKDKLALNDELVASLMECATQAEKDDRNHWGAILAALRLLRDTGYQNALACMLTANDD